MTKESPIFTAREWLRGGYPAQQIHERTHIPRTTLSEIANGRRVPSRKQLASLAALFHMTPRALAKELRARVGLAFDLIVY